MTDVKPGDVAERLEATFCHYHVGPGDKCKSCGLDLRHSIHIRAVQS